MENKEDRKDSKDSNAMEATINTETENEIQGSDEADNKTEHNNVELNPEEVLYEVDVHMNTSILYDYMLRHTYTSLTGLLATILGVLFLLAFFKGSGFLYLIAGIFVIAYLPWNLYLNAKRQALNNEAFKKPLHYAFTKDGIYVSQGGAMEMQKWENMYQAVATGKSIIIYTSKVNASIFPRVDLGTEAVTLIELISRYMNPKKVKIKQ